MAGMKGLITLFVLAIVSCTAKSSGEMKIARDPTTLEMVKRSIGEEDPSKEQFAVNSRLLGLDKKPMAEYPWSVAVHKRSIDELANVGSLEDSASHQIYKLDSGLDQRSEPSGRRFNFGLGKRSVNNIADIDAKRAVVYTYEPGKRIRPFNFGLGKRSDGMDYRMLPDSSRLSININDDIPLTDDSSDLYLPEARELLMQGIKRSPRHYDFGLGKRTGYALRDPFDVIKRPRSGKYQFGLGKRYSYDAEDERVL